MDMLTLVQGDITERRVDAIVNAASESLLGGGGVDGAIHRAAGPDLLHACRAIALVRPGVRCPTGDARLTPAFKLPARWVIHTVGPVWKGGGQGEPELLASCYRRSLALARQQDTRSMAFPAISCGVFGYPPAAAAAIAVRTLRGELARTAEPGSLQRIELVAYNPTLAEELDSALRDAVPNTETG